MLLPVKITWRKGTLLPSLIQNPLDNYILPLVPLLRYMSIDTEMIYEPSTVITPLVVYKYG